MEYVIVGCIWWRSPISFEHVSLVLLVLCSWRNHTPLTKYRCPIKKSNQITPAHLKVPWKKQVTMNLHSKRVSNASSKMIQRSDTLLVVHLKIQQAWCSKINSAYIKSITYLCFRLAFIFSALVFLKGKGQPHNFFVKGEAGGWQQQQNICMVLMNAPWAQKSTWNSLVESATLGKIVEPGHHGR